MPAKKKNTEKKVKTGKSKNRKGKKENFEVLVEKLKPVETEKEQNGEKEEEQNISEKYQTEEFNGIDSARERGMVSNPRVPKGIESISLGNDLEDVVVFAPRLAERESGESEDYSKKYNEDVYAKDKYGSLTPYSGGEASSESSGSRKGNSGAEGSEGKSS